MSFAWHYNDKALCYLSVLTGFILALALSKLAFDSVLKQRSDPQNDPSWLVFLAAASFIAWLSGVALGDLNYFYNLEPFYTVNTLNVYDNPYPVDPSTMPGQRVMDAGRMTFVKGTRLNLTQAMAFRNLDIYCVAPIVNPPDNKNQQDNKNQDVKVPNVKTNSYDFWAVGLNCCSGAPGDFSCGEYNNPHAVSGLRVMREDQRDFYRLAVQQAEAAYGIRASHPLFFYWMQDPIAEIQSYMDEGVKYYVFGVFTFFAFMVFLLIVALVIFSKMS